MPFRFLLEFFPGKNFMELRTVNSLYQKMRGGCFSLLGAISSQSVLFVSYRDLDF